MKKIIFMGTPTFAVPILESLIQSNYEIVLVVTQPDRPKGRKRVLTPSPVKEVAMDHQIPLFQPEQLKKEYEHLKKYEADLIVTAAYGQLLPSELLHYPTFGSINVHASLLPELRGGAPIHHAILQGKKETGITIMYMVEKLDAGDIIAQSKIPILHDDHVGILHDKLAQLGASLLIDTLPSIFNRTNKRIRQDETKATFASNILREDEKIDWNAKHLDVYNHIRGLHPWPGAYANLKNQRFKICWAELDDTKYVDQTSGNPGEIIEIVNDESIKVICGNNRAINITEIQPAGKKRMSVSEFLLGNPNQLKVGQKLE